jgi:CRP-like cAMP-binding protein
MTHITRFKNDSICHQHDSSDSFYIIVKGSAVATIDEEEDAESDLELDTTVSVSGEDIQCRTVAKKCPEQIEVGRIDVLGCFGEGSLAKEGSHICSATVTVDSDRCDLLRLKRKDFLAMDSSSSTFQAHHDDHKSVLEQLNEIKMERTKSNRMLLEQRKSVKQMSADFADFIGVGVGEDEGVKVKETLKPRPLKEKGVPALLATTSGSMSERSLFS